MILSKAEIEQKVSAVPHWFHSIDAGQGVVTKGHKSATTLQREWQSLQLPPLQKRTVLDINCWDGFFAFEAERQGAHSVTALDSYVWSVNWHQYQADKQKGCLDKSLLHQSPYWFPETLPGRAGFDIVHQMRSSQVRAIVGDFMEIELSGLGLFDVVFFLGSLYHMENPLLALQRVAQVTREVALIETEAIYLQHPQLKGHALCEFFPSRELNDDPTNWWAPNQEALVGLCRAAGFSKTIITVSHPQPYQPKGWKKFRAKVGRAYRLLKDVPDPLSIQRHRAVIQAWK